jgi:putative ABC transport system ATP-binding protein
MNIHMKTSNEIESVTSANSPRDRLFNIVDVVKHYTNGNVTAVDHVSFSIDRGEYMVIMGPSGCGKSSLLNLIGALDKPTSGEVYFCDQSLSKHPSLDQFRASQIGFVFQSFHLLPTLNSLENIQVPMFVMPWAVSKRVARAKELLDLVGMSHRSRALPSQLSTGERQRVAIARALANEPCALLADEPTGNLDSQTGEEVLDIFSRLHEEKGTTIVVITHSPELAKRAERVIHMIDGRIVRVENRPS